MVVFKSMEAIFVRKEKFLCDYNSCHFVVKSVGRYRVVLDCWGFGLRACFGNVKVVFSKLVCAWPGQGIAH